MRIEATNWEDELKSMDIEFNCGISSINLTFTKKELECLNRIIAETLELWAKKSQKKKGEAA